LGERGVACAGAQSHASSMGAEFASRALDARAYREDVRLDFSRPEKPTDNAQIESFNARLRAECLNAHVFESLEDAAQILASWRRDYNAMRPHSALGMLTPKEFAELGQRNAGRSMARIPRSSSGIKTGGGPGALAFL
jgi:putative transposase